MLIKHAIRLKKAFAYSLQGLRVLWQEEAAFQLELVLLVVVSLLLLIIPFASYIKFTLFLLMLFLMTIEAVNSAIEHTVDRISLDRHPLSKSAKDIGSAAVLLACLMNLFAWMYALNSLLG